jgi:hypothetical protein
MEKQHRPMSRIEREIKTVGIMIDMYCRHHHGADQLCESCRELSGYARQRALKCPFGEDKPVCSKCRIHCYKADMKAKIKEVMKFSGPRMVHSHPILAVRHLMAARKEPPAIKKRPEKP